MIAGIVLLAATGLAMKVAAYDTTFGFDGSPIIEHRSLDDIYQAALAEGGIVTAWHGGDETHQPGRSQKGF